MLLLATVAMIKTKPRNYWKSILAGIKEEHHKDIIHISYGSGFVQKEHIFVRLHRRNILTSYEEQMYVQ